MHDIVLGGHHHLGGKGTYYNTPPLRTITPVERIRVLTPSNPLELFKSFYCSLRKNYGSQEAGKWIWFDSESSAKESSAWSLLQMTVKPQDRKSYGYKNAISIEARSIGDGDRKPICRPLTPPFASYQLDTRQVYG